MIFFNLFNLKILLEIYGYACDEYKYVLLDYS